MVYRFRTDNALRAFMVLARLTNEALRHHGFASEWVTRRKALEVQLADLPILVEAHALRRSKPHPRDPEMQFVEATPHHPSRQCRGGDGRPDLWHGRGGSRLS